MKKINAHSRRKVLKSTAALGTVAGIPDVVSTTRSLSIDIDRIQGGRVELVESKPDEGFNFPYLLFLPDDAAEQTLPLHVTTHNSPPAENTVELREQLADRAHHPIFAPARDNQHPGIVAGFPRTENDDPDQIQTMALPSHNQGPTPSQYSLSGVSTSEFSADSLERVDQQLIAMADDARKELADKPYSLTEKFHMSGFSAAKTFAHRFAILHPTEVEAISSGGGPPLILPASSHNGTELPYPLGTADYEKLTGREFDREAWGEIYQYITVGEEDQPLPGPDSRGYFPGSVRYPDRAEEVFGVNRVTERFPFVEKEYTKVSDSVEFEIYDGVDHTIPDRLASDMIAFHAEHAPEPPQTESEPEVNTDDDTEDSIDIISILRELFNW